MKIKNTSRRLIACALLAGSAGQMQAGFFNFWQPFTTRSSGEVRGEWNAWCQEDTALPRSVKDTYSDYLGKEMSVRAHQHPAIANIAYYGGMIAAGFGGYKLYQWLKKKYWVERSLLAQLQQHALAIKNGKQTGALLLERIKEVGLVYDPYLCELALQFDGAMGQANCVLCDEAYSALVEYVQKNDTQRYYQEIESKKQRLHAHWM